MTLILPPKMDIYPKDTNQRLETNLLSIKRLCQRKMDLPFQNLDPQEAVNKQVLQPILEILAN